MTVETTSARVQYGTNGTTGPWTVPFYFLDDDHLQVIHTDSDGVEAVLSSADYTVTGAGDENGGYVTTDTAYSSGGYITILRSIEPLQETDLIDGDSLPSETLERALDKLTMISQQQGEVIGRALVYSPSDTEGATLPAASVRAGKLLGFDSSGVLSLNAPASGSAADLALDLANAANASKGAGMVGAGPSVSYASGTIGYALIKRDYNVLVNGAYGDGGVHDDYAVIQAGLTAGRWVVLPKPPVAYSVATALAMGANSGIIGEGPATTILRKVGGGSVITCVGSSGSLGPYYIEGVKIGGVGAIGITEASGGYSNYVSRLTLRNVSTEGDLVTGIDANLIYFNADTWWDGYDYQTSTHASHKALVASFGGANNTNLNTIRNCKFNQGKSSYTISLSGGVQWLFDHCDWSINVRNLYAINLSALRVIGAYTEGSTGASNSWVFGVDPTTRGRAVFDGGTYDGGAMASGCAMFGFAPTATAVVTNADIIVPASGYAYLDTTTTAHFPTSGRHYFSGNRYAGNTSDPLYFLDNVQDDTPQAWTPSPTSLTIAGSPGTATYSGFWSIRNRMVTVHIRIVPAGTSTTAATAATTFFALPANIPAPTHNTAGSVVNETLGNVGQCFAYSNGRVYMGGWTAQQSPIAITVTYPI